MTSVAPPSPETTDTTQKTLLNSNIQDSSKQRTKTDINNANSDENDFEDEFKDDTILLDPLSGYNRLMTSFNDTAYIYVLNPTSKVYAAVLPEFLRIGLSRAFHNIKFPIALSIIFCN